MMPIHRRTFLLQSMGLMGTAAWTTQSGWRLPAAAFGTEPIHPGVDQSVTAKLLWQVELKSPCYGGASLGALNGESALVFGTYYNDEHLYALRARDGQLLWKFKSDAGPFDASVAIHDLDGDGAAEVLAADSSSGTLFCLDGSGRPKWTHRLPNSTDSPPALADVDGDGRLEIVVGVMAMQDKHGRVLSLDPATRQEKWIVKVPGHVQSEPALVNLGHGRLDVIVTTWRGDKKVRALSGMDGQELWSHEMKGDMYHGITAVERDGLKILAHSIAGDVALLDAAGQPLWQKQPGGYLFAPAAAADLDGDGVPEFIVCGDRVIVFRLDGEVLWQSNRWQSIARGAAVAWLDGKPCVCVGSKDRLFRVLDGGTGKVRLQYDATIQKHVYEGIDSAPVVADFDEDGALEAFFVCGKGTSDATKPQNFGRAMAVKLGKGTGAWPMFRGNLRRTGMV